jgi:predicted nucleic-acid-binding protein
MRPSENIEKLVKNIDIDTNAKIDEEVLIEVVEAFEKSKVKKTSAIEQNIGRIIMKSKITKLGTAAVIIVAIMLGMYALIGSFDGTSITMAQVRQAIENIDWVNAVVKAEEESMSVWYSLASKVQIVCQSKGRILYRDFNAGKELVWNPGSEDIYESPIDEGREFAGGVSNIFNIFEGLTKLFNSIEAKGDYKVTRELGTFQGQEVEIWTARRVKGKAGPTHTEIFTMYIDVDKKLPIASTDVKKGANGDIQLNVEFKYPKTGPADIYEAGAPRSAQIKPSPEQ